MAKKKRSAFDEFSTEAPPSGDPLAEPIQVDSIHVPNHFPLVHNQPYRIAIIGDYPGRADVYHKRHFCRQGTDTHPYAGSAGAKLDEKLSQAGIARDACFIGTVCQHSGFEDMLDKKVDLSHAQCQADLLTLTAELEKYNPNLCLLLGRAALYAAKGTTNVDAWRGSVFFSDVPGPFFGRKCIVSHHPRVCMAQYSLIPLFAFDIMKAAKQGKTSTFIPPFRNLRINMTVQETVDELIKIKQTKPTIAIDIEGYVDAMSCISIAPSPEYAFIVPLAHKNNDNYYSSLEDEVLIWKHLSSVLEDASIPKVLQNSLYDRFVLQYSYGLVVGGVMDDTMLRHWELYCEFEKNLGFQCSVYTDEPYYKQERKDPDIDTFHRYCCRDSAVTLEINQKLSKYLSPAQNSHYRFNIALLNPLLYMENRGILYDKPAAEACLRVVEEHLAVLQSKLDSITGKGCPGYESLHQLLGKVQEVMCYKKDSSQPKKDYVEIYPRIRQILSDCVTGNRQPTVTELNYISVESGFSMNIRAPMFREYLYGPLGLPEQKKKNERDEWVITADYEALLKLQKIRPTEVVDLAIQIGVLRTRSQMLGISADGDGRVRCGYNVVGTETGRLTCYTSPTGSGYNLQTIPDKDKSKPEGHPLREGMRHLFKADPGYHMFQCDLSGADGWTIGANLASLGDRTMLDDLRAKIKPAAKICYMLRHGNNSLLGKSRDEQKELLKEVKKEDWDYFACKQGIWGTCLTGDHEVLTKTGWVLFSSLSDYTEIATWSPDGETIQWEIPLKVIRQNYSGSLYSFTGNSFDLLCTADHQIPYYTNNNFKKKNASAFAVKGAQMPKAGYWKGGNRKEPLAKLVAAIMSDGYYPDNRTALIFNFRKERKITRMRELLIELNIEFKETVYWCERDQCNETRFYCPNGPIFSKTAGAWMLDWDYNSIKLFCDEYVHWDGTSGPNNCRTLFAVNKTHIDWIATLQTIGGGGYVYQGEWESGKGSMIHRLTLNNRKYASFDSMTKTKHEVVNYPVYCVATKAGNFLTRRKDKIMISGNCYLMGHDTLIKVIAIQSEGKMWLSKKEVTDFQAAVFQAYKVKLWQDWMQRKLSTKPELIACNGFKRRFFSRANEALGQALSHEPQVITTYATNQAMYKLWRDPENRVDNKLRIEPLHQVHDALLGQFKVEDTEWAIGRIKQYFLNEVIIAGIKLTIPFEGNYGESWGNLNAGTI